VEPGGVVRELLTAPEPEALRRAIRSRNAIPAGASNVLVRADLIRRVGGFDPRLAHLADWDLWIRLTEAATPGRCAEVHVAYLLHASNMHLRQAGEVTVESRYLRAKHAASRLPGRLDAAALDGWQGWANVRAGRHMAAAGCFSRALARGGGRGYARSLASALLQATGLWRPSRRVPAPDWLGAV
jgi:GT2 family glycosyltransferase